MYFKQIAKKVTPSLQKKPISQQIAPNAPYAPMSDVVQRLQKDPSRVSDDERQQLERAIGTRSVQAILAGKQGGSWIPDFKGVSAELKGDTGTLSPPIQKKETDEVGVTQEQPENKTGLPDQLKTGVENLSGYSLDNVRVHYNSPKPEQLQAHAYTQGTDIHVAPGQEQHLPHETWHVVQQMQGRVKPTMQMNGVKINDDEGLEREADVMAVSVEQKGSASVEQSRSELLSTQCKQPVSQKVETTKNPNIDHKPAKLHIHADLDAPGMSLRKQLKTGNVGHAWISLQWKDPSGVPNFIPENHRKFLVKGGIQADPMGFWPKMFDSFDPLTQQWSNLPPTERVGYSSNPFKSYVPGQMLHPDTIHSAKATQSYDITGKQAASVINYAESKRKAEYSVFFYNCTTFAKEAAKAGGQSPPSMGTLGICYPDALYKSIVKNQEKRIGTTSVTDNTGNVTTIVGSPPKKG